MKRNPGITPLFLGFLLVLAVGGFTACDDESEVTAPDFQFTISAACEATDGSGNPISQLELVAGQKVTYTNNWTAQTELKFDVAGFVPGGTTLTLQPGQSVTHVVESAVVDGNYQWMMNCQGSATPGGGGPVKVDNPPPGP